MKMKPLMLLTICLLMTVVISAQTQQGYVKTKGRLGTSGVVIAGTRLSGATVIVRGGNAVVSGNNGAFSLSITNNNYYLQNVQKQGYVLTDPDVLAKQYAYSKNPLVLVLETPSQQADDKIAVERQIRRTLQRQLQDKEDEIESLKEQQKLNEEEYRKQLQELYSQQESNEKLIGDMADRYSKMDFDEVDEFNRRISQLILDGKLTEADSLLNTKGDINSRTIALRQHQEANAQEEQELKKKQKKLEKSKAMIQKELEDIAQDCYSKFEIFKMQHQNDSAAFYIELRASLDPSNIEWQNTAGCFIEEYIADYSLALKYFMHCMNLSISNDNEYNTAMATAYNNIGEVYNKKGDFDTALRYFYKALEIDSLIGNELSSSYNSIGVIYHQQGNLSKALECLQKALDIRTGLYGLQHKDVATCYSNIGYIYSDQAEYEQALSYHKKALEIRTKIYGENHHKVADTYNNIGVVYYKMGDYSKALEYMLRDLTINTAILGESHPDIASSYSNIGNVYMKLKEYIKALDCFQKILLISTNIYGKQHPSIADCYNNIGYVYSVFEDYPKAIENCKKGLVMRISIYGEQHWEVANSYYNLGTILYHQDNFANAIDYYEKALLILKHSFGEQHPNTKMVSDCLEKARKELSK